MAAGSLAALLVKHISASPVDACEGFSAAPPWKGLARVLAKEARCAAPRYTIKWALLEGGAVREASVCIPAKLQRPNDAGRCWIGPPTAVAISCWSAACAVVQRHHKATPSGPALAVRLLYGRRLLHGRRSLHRWRWAPRGARGATAAPVLASAALRPKPYAVGRHPPAPPVLASPLTP
jgi:hypothetical protein